MPLRLRRGTNAERLGITPAAGELIYVTDTKRLFVGDGTTVGGLDVVTSSGGSLPSDLNLNTHNITGVGNINIAGSISGNSLNGPLTGNVTGNLTGNVTGNTTGTHFGNVTGNVTGTLSGNVTGNVTGNLTGGVLGNVTGNITGNSFGTHTGDVLGDVYGSVYSNDSTILIDSTNNSLHTNSMNIFDNIITVDPTITTGFGNQIGVLQLGGDVAGNANPHMQTLQRWEDPVTIMTKRIGTSLGFNSIKTETASSRGNISNPTALIEGDIIHGDLFTGYDGFSYVLSSAALYGADNQATIVPGIVPGKFTWISIGAFGSKQMTFDSFGRLAINKENASETLDVEGNGVFSGSVTAASFRGTFIADDSTLIIDGATATVAGSTVTGGSVQLSGNTISTSDSSNLVVGQNTRFTSDVVIDGRIEINEFSSSSLGIPEISSATDLKLSAGNSVVISNSSLRFANLTTAERNGLLPNAGSVIYNTTEGSLQVYHFGTWDNILLSSGTFKGTVVADDSTIVIDGLNGNVTGNNVNVNEILTVTNSTPHNSVQVTGYANRGGTGYHDFLSATNTYGSATNPSKHFRLNSTGILEIVDSDYLNVIWQVTNDGHTISKGYVQFGSFTTTERNGLPVSNGMVIYNTTVNKFQGYQGGAWINLDDGSLA